MKKHHVLKDKLYLIDLDKMKSELKMDEEDICKSYGCQTYHLNQCVKEGIIGDDVLNYGFEDYAYIKPEEESTTEK